MLDEKTKAELAPGVLSAKRNEREQADAAKFAADVMGVIAREGFNGYTVIETKAPHRLGPMIAAIVETFLVQAGHHVTATFSAGYIYSDVVIRRVDPPRPPFWRRVSVWLRDAWSDR